MSDETLRELLEVQAHFRLPSVALVEKDLHVVRAIAALTAIDATPFALVFGRGTALARAHRLVRRVSEDVGFKIVLLPAAPRAGQEFSQPGGRQSGSFACSPLANYLLLMDRRGFPRLRPGMTARCCRQQLAGREAYPDADRPAKYVELLVGTGAGCGATWLMFDLIDHLRSRRRARRKDRPSIAVWPGLLASAPQRQAHRSTARMPANRMGPDARLVA